MKCFLKAIVLLPILAGIVLGSLLFAIGALDDAPGMCAIGLSIGFFLVMRGIYNSGIMKKGLLAPILHLCYGIFVSLLTTAILLDKEFADRPWLALIGYALAIFLLVLGAKRLNAFLKANQ